MKLHTTGTLFLLTSSAIAAPVVGPRSPAGDMVAKIAPGTAACSGDVNAECRTAEQVSARLIEAQQKYSVMAAGQIAAIIALEAFESGDFKYKRNLQSANSLDHAGQGTSNMQMFDFNLEYAKSIPELASKVEGISTNDIAGRNQVLDLLVDDKYNFASGFWYFSTKCSNDVKSQLAATDATSLDAGFAAYIQSCVQTGLAERQEYWTRAKAAFDLA